MSPVRAARVRHCLRSVSMARCVQLAGNALACKTTSEVRSLLKDALFNLSGEKPLAIGERTTSTA
jgi:phosphoenolpyruvate-protein kinase (PTS system EI component)